MSESLVGRVIGEFKILENIGDGAFASVFRGENSKGDVRAIKVFKRSDYDVSKLETEARRQSKIRHPNIVRVFSSNKSPPALIMEYLPNGDLASKISDSNGINVRNQSTAVKIASQILEGLKTIHHYGYAHCDLKPHNILFDSNYNAKISDFGLVNWLPDAATIDRTMSVVNGVGGTPAYRSPEQAIGKFDVRSDIYSVGVTLYQMLTGKLPMETGTESPRKVKDDILPALDEIVVKALSIEPSDRFQSAGEMLSALNRIIPVTELSATIVKRRSIVSYFGAGIAGLILGISSQFIIGTDKTSDAVLDSSVVQETIISSVSPAVVESAAVDSPSASAYSSQKLHPVRINSCYRFGNTYESSEENRHKFNSLCKLFGALDDKSMMHLAVSLDIEDGYLDHFIDPDILESKLDNAQKVLYPVNGWDLEGPMAIFSTTINFNSDADAREFVEYCKDTSIDKTLFVLDIYEFSKSSDFSLNFRDFLHEYATIRGAVAFVLGKEVLIDDSLSRVSLSEDSRLPVWSDISSAGVSIRAPFVFSYDSKDWIKGLYLVRKIVEYAEIEDDGALDFILRLDALDGITDGVVSTSVLMDVLDANGLRHINISPDVPESFNDVRKDFSERELFVPFGGYFGFMNNSLAEDFANRIKSVNLSYGIVLSLAFSSSGSDYIFNKKELADFYRTVESIQGSHMRREFGGKVEIADGATETGSYDFCQVFLDGYYRIVNGSEFATLLDSFNSYCVGANVDRYSVLYGLDGKDGVRDNDVQARFISRFIDGESIDDIAVESSESRRSTEVNCVAIPIKVTVAVFGKDDASYLFSKLSSYSLSAGVVSECLRKHYNGLNFLTRSQIDDVVDELESLEKKKEYKSSDPYKKVRGPD